MIPGQTIIRECSACGKHIAERTIISGNNCGARYWTDGKEDAPFLPDLPPLIKCQHCDTLVWIEEQRQVGKIKPCGKTRKFADARPASTPTFQDYVGFLGVGVDDKVKERYVRLRTWWAGNDSRRESSQPTPLDSFETQNLRVFVTLLDEAEDDDRIVKAEALRELGEYADAEKLLATEFEDESLQFVSFIRDLTQKRIATVAEIIFE